MKTKKAIYAGSFDPITNGHLDIIKRSSNLFDEVIVSVGKNPFKKYYFSEEERIRMIEHACSNIPEVKVKSMGNDLLVHYAKKENATHIVRGIRSHRDFDEEATIQRVNKDINHNIETVFFIPNKEFIDVSSSLVKALIGPKYWHHIVSKYVPENACNCIFEKEFEKYCREFLIEKLSLTKNFDAIFKDVLFKYRSNGRFYHNETHIMDMLQECKNNYSLFDNEKSCKIAILMHDIEKTEKESVEYFSQSFSKNLFKITDCQLEEITGLIMATDHSREDFENFTNDQKLIHDIDLLIIASDPEIYKAYSENIFKEYCQSYSKIEFIKGRIIFLNKMLKRKQIFLHDKFKDIEDNARLNMKEELKQLA